MELEQAGVPVVTLVSQIFQRLGEMESKYLGIPQLPLVIVPHPVGGVSETRVREIGDRAMAAIEAALLTPTEQLEKHRPK